MNRIKFWAACVAGVAAFPINAARADDPKIAGPTSYVRVLHAVSGGTKVDVYIDGEKKLNDIEFAHLSKYLRVRSGYHTFRIVGNDSPVTLWSGTRSLRAGDFYTIGAYGSQAWKKPLIHNDSVGYPRYGMANLTVFHLSPNLGPVDVYAYGKGGKVYRLLRGLRYGQIRRANVRPELQSIRLIRRNGAIVKTATGFEPRAGRKYAALALGHAGRNFQLQVDNFASQ